MIVNTMQEQLRTDLNDRVPTDRLRQALFNGALKPQARSLTVCNDESAVQCAVRAAVASGTPVAVVAGGHDMWGRGFIADNTILDIGAMTTVEVDEESGTITMGGGALAGDLIAALPPDRAAVTGTILGVGMAGLTLAGG
jgi:FAD/FMN-containing dehydrogenase